MMGYLLQISQANNMIEKFIIGKRIKGLYVFLYFYAQQSLESKYMDTN